MIEETDKFNILLILVVVNCKHTYFHHTPAPQREVPSSSVALKKSERVFHLITGTKERKPLRLLNGATTQVLLDSTQGWNF